MQTQPDLKTLAPTPATCMTPGKPLHVPDTLSVSNTVTLTLNTVGESKVTAPVNWIYIITSASYSLSVGYVAESVSRVLHMISYDQH